MADTVVKTFCFHLERDADLLEWLGGVEAGKQSAEVRRLLRVGLNGSGTMEVEAMANAVAEKLLAAGFQTPMPSPTNDSGSDGAETGELKPSAAALRFKKKNRGKFSRRS